MFSSWLYILYHIVCSVPDCMFSVVLYVFFLIVCSLLYCMLCTWLYVLYHISYFCGSVRDGTCCIWVYASDCISVLVAYVLYLSPPDYVLSLTVCSVPDCMFCAWLYVLCLTVCSVPGCMFCAWLYVLCLAVCSVPGCMFCAGLYVLCRTVCSVADCMLCVWLYVLCLTVCSVPDCMFYIPLCRRPGGVLVVWQGWGRVDSHQGAWSHPAVAGL